jgi:hypothetical protein
MKVGDTFLHPLSPPNSEHLWIVLTNPDEADAVLIVSVTTVYAHDKDNIDMTVTLNKGEHQFLTKPISYVYYREAQVKKVSELRAEEKLGRLKMHQPCSQKIIDLVRAGVTASEHCRRSAKQFYKERKDVKPK